MWLVCNLQLAGVGVGDFIVSVSDVDVKWARHEKVVAMIRDCGLSVRLSLVTPIDRNFVDPDSVSRSDRDMESISVSRLHVQPDVEVQTPLNVSHHAIQQRPAQAETPTLSRYWAFRRKRNKNS